MANKQLFKSAIGRILGTNAVNSHGAPAYAFETEHCLAQYALTGCMNSTFYASAEQQLDNVIEMARKVTPDYLAKLAVYSRQKGYMKDLPAVLTAVLSTRDSELFARVFDQVIDNGRMLRTFVQIMRSGQTGRKSLGSLPKRKIREWMDNLDDDALFRSSVGNSPSMADIIKMVHPRPEGKSREALLGYLIGKNVPRENLPVIVQQYEEYKNGTSCAIPHVPFEMLTTVRSDTSVWKRIAAGASWQMTRMNLNNFQKYGVFEDRSLMHLIARRLRDRSEIARAKVFPYQLLMAFKAAGNAPQEIREALQDAMEIAIENVPSLNGKVVILPDVSGSMSSPATGYRAGSTTSVRCIDIAALVAAAVLRKNRDATVLPFEQKVVDVTLNRRDSVMTNAEKLAAIGGGGTNCSAPLAKLNAAKATADAIIYVSDNESWVDAGSARTGTAVMREWERFKARNPKARLVCIDIQPNRTSQAKESQDILNIGGFSDQVFSVIADFLSGDHEKSLVAKINSTEI